MNRQLEQPVKCIIRSTHVPGMYSRSPRWQEKFDSLSPPLTHTHNFYFLFYISIFYVIYTRFPRRASCNGKTRTYVYIDHHLSSDRTRQYINERNGTRVVMSQINGCVYAPMHRRVVFQRMHSMSKSLGTLDKNWLFRRKAISAYLWERHKDMELYRT